MTKQTQATPGEWLLADSDKRFIYALDEAGMNRWSAQVTPNNGYGRDEAEAAARLMLAAPDLRDALRTAVKLVEADVICARPANRETLIEALRGWNAALAKLDN